MIRTASHDDLPEVVKLGAEFHAYSPHRQFPLDEAHFEGFAAQLIEHGALFLSDDGMIGGMMSPLYFNPAVRIAVELFWWARKEGAALRKAFEEWAMEQGATAIQFSGLCDARLDAVTKVYARAGYAPAEIVFIKKA